MAKALAVLRERLRKVKPWAAVTGALGVALLLYSAFQANRWQSANQDVDAYETDFELLQAEVREAGPSREALEQERDDRKRLLEQWASVFTQERYRVTITDNSGETSTEVAHVNIVGDAEGWLDLDISPGVKYDFKVEHTGIARHYKLGTSHPQLDIGHREVRYLSGAVQEWDIKAAEGEQVRLQLATDTANEGSPQATEIGVTVTDMETELILYGPTTTEITPDSAELVLFSNTSTARKLRVRLEPDGHFRLRKVGGDELLYLVPCPPEGNAATEIDDPSCAIGIFEGDDAHDWTLVWTTSTPPEPGEARLRLVASTADTFDEISISATDQLLEVVYTTASETGVLVSSAEVKGQTKDGDTLLKYEGRTLSVVIVGKTHADIFAFLTELHRKMSGLDVTDPNLSGFGGEPRGDFVLRFYQSPELIEAQ